MRVLLTTHQFFPQHHAGTEVAARDAGLELMRRGHEVHMLTVNTDQSGESPYVAADTYAYRGMQVCALRLPKKRDAREGLLNEYRNEEIADHVSDYLDDVDPDIVHMFHLARLSLSVVECFRARGLPLVFTSTDFWSICTRNTLAKPNGNLCTGPDELSSNCLECRHAERWFWDTESAKRTADRQFYEGIAKRAAAPPAPGEHRNMKLVRIAAERNGAIRKAVNGFDAILAPTEFMRKTLVANGIRPDLVRTSPYGLDLAGAHRARERRTPGAGIRFGYVGTIHAQKGVHLAVEAFRRLPRDREVSLRIVGNVQGFPEYGRRICKLTEDDERINLTGFIPNEQVDRQLELIDVLVTPSTWYENSPLTIYAALSAGIPVIATDIGGISEVVRHEQNGLLFETGNVDDLERQMLRVVEEPQLLAALAANAEDARHAADLVEELLPLYEELTSSQSRAERRSRHASDPPARTRRPRSPKTGKPAAPAPPPGREIAVRAPRILETAKRIEPPARRRPQIPGPRRPVATGPRRPPPDRALFFVVGRAKSGTSWLMRALNAHPEILCQGEGRFFGRDYVLGDSGVRSLYGSLLRSDAVESWSQNSAWTKQAEFEVSVRMMLRASVSELLFRAADAAGARVVGDKTPLTGNHVIAEIAEITPEAKVLHIIRDGRDVAVSSVHHVWNQAKQEGGFHELSAEQLDKRNRYRADPVAFVSSGESIFSAGELDRTARDWTELTTHAVDEGSRLGPDLYMEVRYEDLLKDAPGRIGEILSFLGVDRSRKVVNTCVNRTTFEKMSRGRKQGEEDSSSFMRKGVAGDWVNVFTGPDRETFNEIAEPLLLRLGYQIQQ